MLEFPSMTFPELLIFNFGIFSTGYACAGEGLPWWFRLCLIICIFDTYFVLMKLVQNKFGGKKI